MAGTELWAVISVLIATFIGSAGPIFLKKASSQVHRQVKTIVFNKNLLAGILSYGIATIIFIPSLKGGELSVLYPLVATMYVWVSLLSVRFLGEKMNKLKWIGVFLIILGVASLGLGAR